VIRGFKIGVTKWFRQNTHIQTVWQRNYYEHIIRNEESLNRIREYIATNPLRWHLDRENPARTGTNPQEEEWFA
jgi:REP element-mobilizing transposase RayT